LEKYLISLCIFDRRIFKGWFGSSQTLGHLVQHSWIVSNVEDMKERIHDSRPEPKPRNLPNQASLRRLHLEFSLVLAGLRPD
jgi:hypothetical protein